MATPAADGGSSSSSSSSHSSKLDPITRNAMRYTLTPREYEAFHRFLVARSPQAVSRRAPEPGRYRAAVKGSDDYNASAVRTSLRLFVASQTLLKVADIALAAYTRRKGAAVPAAAVTSATGAASKTSFFTGKNFRTSISVSLLLFLHRILHRFFSRLRANLLTKDATPFRRRNPRISRALTSQLAPAIGASLAGFALGLAPAAQLRITLAIWVSTKGLEYGYNALEEEGYLKNKPWWFGSWLLMPPIFGQLLHAFVFDRECFPTAFGKFIMGNSGTYIQARPPDYPASQPWPNTDGIVDGLAEISRLRHPAFVSPILYPNAKSNLASSLASIEPVTASAHPSISNLSCALLHPTQPSCARTMLEFYLRSIPRFARFFTIVFGLLSLVRYKAFIKQPTTALNKLAERILRMTVFVAGAIGTAWGSICLFGNVLPRRVAPTTRWFWGGFLGGLWAFIQRDGGRGQFTYCLRLSVDSVWKVGVKRGWWRAGATGDVWVFVAGLALMNVVYERCPSAVDMGVLRKVLSSARGDGWVDKVAAEKAAEAEEEKKRS